MDRKNKKIYVSLFGRFYIRQEENGRCQGQKKFTSKEGVCLAYLLLNKNRAITKEELIEVLWGGKDSRNPVNALKTLIHRLRQHLNEHFGENDYVLELGGQYQWNPKIAIDVDVDLFERYIKNAEDAESIEEKIKNYEMAMPLYIGDILADKHNICFQTTNKKYRALFGEAFHQLNELYLKQEQYEKIENLCIGKLLYDDSKNEDMFYYLITAKIQLSKFEEALDVYYKAEKILNDELGIVNSGKMEELWNKIVYSEKMNQIQDMKMLNEELQEEDNSGAFLCSYLAFKEFYRMEKRKIKREIQSGKSMASEQRILLLFSIDYKDTLEENVRKSMAVHEEEMSLVQKSLVRNLRATDIVTRSNHFQFVALLEECSEKEVRIIEDRIRMELERNNKDIEIKIEFGDFGKIEA